MRKLKTAMFGTGFMGKVHTEGIRRLGNVEVAAVAGSSLATAEKFAAAMNIPKAADWRAVLADPEIDAVHICTPNVLHHSMAKAALEAGKNVLCEKPLTMNAAEARELAAQADAKKLAHCTNHNLRFYPVVQHIRSMVAAGELGDILIVNGTYFQDWLLYETDWNWRALSASNGALRAMGDIGSHWIDLLQHVTGDVVTSVHAQLERVHDTRIRPPEGGRETFASGGGAGEPVAVDTEDMALVLFRTASGIRGSVTISQVSAGWKNRLVLEVDAAEASFVWDQEEPNHLRIGRRDGANRDVLRDPSQLGPAAARLARYPAGHQEGWPDALRNLFDDFYRTIAGANDDVRTLASFVEAARVQAVVEAVLRSDATGVWVEVDDVVKEVSA